MPITLALILGLVVAFAVFWNNLWQCDAKNPKTGRRCKLRTSHKTTEGLRGRWHTDHRGGRWRA